jgi:hypothetical protein
MLVLGVLAALFLSPEPAAAVSAANVAVGTNSSGAYDCSLHALPPTSSGGTVRGTARLSCSGFVSGDFNVCISRLAGLSKTTLACSSTGFGVFGVPVIFQSSVSAACAGAGLYQTTADAFLFNGGSDRTTDASLPALLC